MNRILFVDDEPSVLGGLRRMFRSRHRAWDMAFEESAAAALASLEANPADVIVTDFRMPGTDGGALLSEVRRRFPDTIRLVLSGHTNEHDMIGLTAVAHQFLTKPCAPEELERVVERVLAGRRCVERAAVRAQVCALSALPSPPGSLDILMAVLDTPTPDFGAISAAVARDVALSAKVLQLVNSAFFAPGARITSLEVAVGRIGLKAVRAQVERARQARPGEAVAARLVELNRHAVATARCARELATPPAADDAYCAGLFHVIGSLAVGACQPAASGDTADDMAIGAYLLALWGLPTEITEALTSLQALEPAGSGEPGGPGGLDAAAAVRAAHRLIASNGGSRVL